MLSAPIPSNESERLARLRELFVLDSTPEPLFDSIARMASEVCGTPIALLSLVDENRQWFKANVGLPGVTESPRDVSFCAHAIFDNSLFEVEDATLDARFADNPLVVGGPEVRFYAGAPLVLPGGERVGTLCVIDHEAGKLTPEQGQQMRKLAKMASEALTMRRDLIDRTLLARTRYENQLAQSTVELMDLYAHAPCAFHSVDAQGYFLRVNETAVKWFGCTREELVGKMKISDFLNEEGLTLFREVFPRLVRDGKAENVEFELQGRNGVKRQVMLNATTVKDADGNFLMTRTATYDQSEVARVRNELKAVAAEQRAMLDTDLIGIVRLKERLVTWANRGAEQLLGYGPGELMGVPSRSVYPDDESYRNTGRRVYSMLMEGKPFRTQVQMVRRDGVRLWIDVRGMIMPTHPGEAMVMMADITPMKEAEEARIRSLSLEAENRQLVESNRVKSLFLANMSHELHTPLNAVTGYAYLLQSGAIKPDSPKFADYLGKIGASARQLLGLIDTTLNFAEVESGKLALNPEPVQPARVIADAVAALQGEIRSRRIELVLDVPASLGEVVTDPLRLMQAVSHYLSNAVKFSHAGGRVHVRARAEDDECFRVEVEDGGIGIEPADVPRLFTAFQQLSEGSTKVYGGAGLSLALTKALVEAQGGSVGVSSQPGIGSLFHFVLPRRPLPTAAKSEAAAVS